MSTIRHRHGPVPQHLRVIGRGKAQPYGPLPAGPGWRDVLHRVAADLSDAGIYPCGTSVGRATGWGPKAAYDLIAACKAVGDWPYPRPRGRGGDESDDQREPTEGEIAESESIRAEIEASWTPLERQHRLGVFEADRPAEPTPPTPRRVRINSADAFHDDAAIRAFMGMYGGSRP